MLDTHSVVYSIGTGWYRIITTPLSVAYRQALLIIAGQDVIMDHNVALMQLNCCHFLPATNWP